MPLIYKRTHTPEDANTQEGTEIVVELWLSKKIDSLIVESIPVLSCPADSKQVVVISEFMRVSDAYNERLVRLQHTGGLTDTTFTSVYMSDWYYVLHWTVEIYCITWDEYIGTKSIEPGSKCGSKSNESAFTRGTGRDQALDVTEKIAKKNAMANIYRRLFEMASAVHCHNDCSKKVFTYWVGTVIYETTAKMSSSGETIYTSIATIPYQIEVFCISAVTELEVLPY